MKVIGIGKHKTGTTTLGRAVEILGFDKHAEWSFQRTEDHTAGKIEELLAFSEAYNNLEDVPWCFMYKELYERYKGETMFILTVRKSSELWYESVCNQYDKTPEKFRKDWENPHHTKQQRIAIYEQHNKDVREFFKDKPNFIELCWEKGDGWKELCNFLGKEIPNEPFPFLNRSPKSKLMKFYRWLLGK